MRLNKKKLTLALALLFLLSSVNVFAQNEGALNEAENTNDTVESEVQVENEDALSEVEIEEGEKKNEDEDGVRDYTPKGFVRQPSLLEGGLVNKNEHAVVFFTDGDLFPFPVMLGYRYGLVYWWEVGLDAGGNHGIVQALIHTKMEMIKTRESEFFFWSVTFKTGFKYHKLDVSPTAIFDDVSWIFHVDNTIALRFGEERRKAMYWNVSYYADLDLRTPQRQTDHYIGSTLGFESMIGEHANIFVEGGIMYGINGMETHAGIMFENDVFPVFKFGVALRTGKKTAIYYARETKEKSSLFPDDE